MIVEILPVMGGKPLRLEAGQLIVYNDAGTPIMVAGEFGPAGSVKVAHAADPDFNQVLRAFGHGHHNVVTETVKLNNPDGARLVAGPGI